ncbi:titin-like isoform X2 [Agrilus planipennis]|uniref:Titin-like isoform X2 n=1 Tax=Agrilus planipennis TaxID=224129 RepID=A0A1W4X2X5_AGRPL|nr:titin-like isoform X2 [Agrilus planipennis]
MAVDLKLKRKDNTPWGFRLTGGADVDVPLTVIKVKEGSLAEEAGLLVDDVIVKINGIPTAGLAHEEVHDVIVEAGNELDLVLHRTEKQYDNLEEQDDVIINKEVVLQNLRNLELQNEDIAERSQEVSDEIIAEVISGQSELLPGEDVIGVNFNNVDLSNSKVLETVKSEQISAPEKRWSTFLQKPKGPKPRPKSKEHELPKYPPYNPLKLPKKETKNVTNSDNVTESLEEESNIESPGGEMPANEGQIVDSLSPIPSENTENFELEEQEFSQNVSDGDDYNEQREEEREHQKTVSFESSRSEDIRPTEVLTTSLEEQLAQVQKQLMTLSNLPSSIQSTIEEVTQQLARIASQANQAFSYKADSSVGEQQDVINYDEFSDRVESVDEEELAFEHSDKESEDILEGGGKHFEDIEYEDGEQEGGSDLEQFSPTHDSEEQGTPKPREPTEEEIEEMRREQERIEKQQKVEHLNKVWPWSDEPKPIYKINFLKYTPPPKNLDYLQNSEVFRLLHEMDPPPRRGIAARPEIIPAVQDIYEKRTANREDSTSDGMQR